MHKTFYASGFLYCPSSQQILLQQSENSSGQWSLFGGESTDSSEPAIVLIKVIQKKVGLKLAQNAIRPIYDYFHKDLGKNHFIAYAEVDESSIKTTEKKGSTIAWFTFKQLYKLSLTGQTKQDITVGERVIKAVQRSLEEPVVRPTY